MRSSKITIIRAGKANLAPALAGKSKQLEVTYRNIAKLLASRLPLDDKSFGDKVNEYLETIKRMPTLQKIALRSAYIFSRKVPKEEREDLFQELTLTLLENRIEDERLAYTVARHDWIDWWKRYKVRQHLSLNAEVTDADGQTIEFGELLVGEVEYTRLDGKLDARRLWQKLPSNIQRIVGKRLRGIGINGHERFFLESWVKKNPLILAEHINIA